MIEEFVYDFSVSESQSLCVKEFFCKTSFDKKKHPILLIHGATIASELWVNDCRKLSWCHRLAGLGYHVFTCDLLGFRASSRNINLLKISDTRADKAAKHILKLLDHILYTTSQDKVDVIACSWGTVVLTNVLSENNHNISKAVFYAPISYDIDAGNYWKPKYNAIPINNDGEKSGHIFVDTNSFTSRWNEEIPVDDKTDWRNQRVLISIIKNTMLNSVKQNSSFLIPSGPLADLFDIFSNQLIHQPERIKIPSLVIRADHDQTSTEKSSLEFYHSIHSFEKNYIKIKNGTHFAILEKNMEKIFFETTSFLEKEF
ncbi:alpha/beta fold hydrolase [Halovibrio sp. HP20-50]|uniref:alpha/beta fold hydrolase n=1 Tax=Halovibrio sp. HP20-59 TaxID=3080275 RepID=UPI00294AED36|nr:alpha/beta fold hydrolase [Halovibrio sp. HP20-59]MEA2119070.1 alpha/beta fold hydrolase [Halovibrio sp. HP20-59]